MRTNLISFLFISAAVAACQPDANSQYPQGDEPAGAPAAADAGAAAGQNGVAGPAAAALNPELAPTDPIRLAVMGAINTNLSEQAGRSVALNPEIMRSQGEWVFASGPVRNIDGTAVNWSATPLSAALASGTMDGDVAVVLLHWDGLDWRVVESVIGPTDVPQGGWPAEHHVSPELVGMEAG